MKIRIWLVFTLALLFTTLAPLLAEDPPFILPPEPTTEWLTPRLEEMRTRYGLPALAAAIVMDGRIVAQAAVGYRKEGSPERVTLDDAFHLGSITKPMTAALTAVLVKQGRMRWDMTLQEVFPELVPVMQPDYRTVTIPLLLAHVSGMGYQPKTEGPDEFTKITHSLTGRRYEYVKAALLDKPTAAPGTKEAEVYGGGPIIVAAMEERIMKRPWEELIREYVFKPLKMETAGFGAMHSPDKVDGPWEHVVQNGKVVPVPPPPGYDTEPHAPAGRNVHCSVGDLARFLIAQLPSTGKQRPLLTPRSLEVLHTPVGADLPCPGWFQTTDYWGGNHPIVWHNGSNGQNYASAYVAPAVNAAVCVMTNLDSGRGSVACEYMAHAIEAAIARHPSSGSVAALKLARASNIFHGDPLSGPGSALDDQPGTRWATDDEIRECWLEVDLGKPTTIDQVYLSEAIEYGQRVRAFEIQWRDGEQWRTCFQGGPIGKSLNRRFPPVTTRFVRLNITQAVGPPTIWEFELFSPGQNRRANSVP